MRTVLWVGLAYGVVLVTLLTYTLGLRRRLWRAGRARRVRQDISPR